jgi:uncharacterized NAD(P)/FAD-binding protein YdhS
MKNVTIIGGGACGVAVSIELFLQIVTWGHSNEIEITLIEKEEELGYGLAFGTDQPGHILNTQADLMGIHAAEPRHFADWLKAHGGKSRKDVKGKGSTGHAYTTRKLYGDYVSDQAEYYFHKARMTGVQLEVVHAEAIDIQRTGSTYEVICSNGMLIFAHYVVLALGTPKPNNYGYLNDHSGYIDFPWPSKRIIQSVEGNDHVGILGSSLSAVDTIMTLVDNGHKGKISLFSPDGMLPRVQPEETRHYKRRFLTSENIHRIKRKTLNRVGIRKIFQLFRQEVEEYYGKQIDWKGVKRTGKSAKTFLKWDISCAEKGGDAIMMVAYSLRYEAADIWSSLNIAEKERFKRWLGSHWMINRHAMPLFNAYRISSLFDEGFLNVHAGLSRVEVDSNSGTFLIQMEKKDNVRVNKLINSTGSSSTLSQMNCQLIDNLLKKDYLTEYPVGGALINERTMQTISPKGGDGIYALGHIVNGMMLDVNAVWFNVRTAATLTKEIICKVQNERVC